MDNTTNRISPAERPVTHFGDEVKSTFRVQTLCGPQLFTSHAASTQQDLHIGEQQALLHSHVEKSRG